MMKPTAYLINVGRGTTLDEEALVRALEKNQIAGAALDAFTVEPLPLDSKLWDLSNVIFMPHSSGQIANYVKLVTNLFCENLNCYLNGTRVINVVDWRKGY